MKKHRRGAVFCFLKSESLYDPGLLKSVVELRLAKGFFCPGGKGFLEKLFETNNLGSAKPYSHLRLCRFHFFDYAKSVLKRHIIISDDQIERLSERNLDGLLAILNADNRVPVMLE